MQIPFDRAMMQDFERGLTREWLVTNGLGGYASSTLIGINTRRYHGLLVAAVRPPVQRMALLVRLDVVLDIDDQIFDLMAAEYVDGTVYPQGYTSIESFMLEDGVPTWRYAIGATVLRQSIWMVPDHNITAIRFRVVAGNGPVQLALRPLTAARDHHAVQHGHAEWRFTVEPVSDGARVQATPDGPSLWLLARGATFAPGGDWYWNYLLREERTRGYDYTEDLYQPGTFRVTLQPGASVTLVASAEDPAQGLPDIDVALAHLRNSYARTGTLPVPTVASGRRLPDPLRELTVALHEAAEAFIVRRTSAEPVDGAGVSLIAGYHWFTDWGRDAMISLPGILLASGRTEQAAAILRAFAAYTDQGMIPNRFPDTGEAAEYNTADATLWLFDALRRTLAAERDAAAAERLLADLYPRLREIVAWHQRGTRYGIGVDPADGLLRAGMPGTTEMPATQLTWMDARYGDMVYTPRVGKPVEINALWIAALDAMTAWAPQHDDDPAPYRAAADEARASFARRFWYAAGGYLYDVVDGPDGDDPSLRPNQLIALALDAGLLPDQQARPALAAIAERLLTPYGLRSLAPDDPGYKGRCVGDQPTRDSAYHQGTVWPWLLGRYADAHLRLHGDAEALRDLLLPFVAHLREAGIGSVSEIFDGDPPYTPRGCIAQAWNVAELLRVALLLAG